MIWQSLDDIRKGFDKGLRVSNAMKAALAGHFFQGKRLFSLCLLAVFVLWGIFSIKNLVYVGGRSSAEIDVAGAFTHQRGLIGFTRLLRDLIQKAAPDGDVFVTFEGPELRNEIGLFIYYYWSYLIYPRRLLVSDESAIIKNTDTFLQNLHDPDDLWLTQRGINKVVTLRSDQEGNINLTVRDLE